MVSVSRFRDSPWLSGEACRTVLSKAQNAPIWVYSFRIFEKMVRSWVYPLL